MLVPALRPAPCSYFRDTYNLKSYFENNKFLTDLNNEKVINEAYKTKILNLDIMLIIRFLDEDII